MANRTMADAVREVFVKRAFVPGDPAAGGMPPPGGMPPGGDPAAGGMPPPGMDPSMMGGMDPMAGLPPMGPDAAMAGAMPQTGMINMTADEFTKFVKQMMAAFGQNGGAQQQQTQPDIGAKLDTLIAVLQGQAKPTAPAAPAAPAVVSGV